MTSAEMEIKKVLDEKCGFVPETFSVARISDILGLDDDNGLIVVGGCMNGVYAIFSDDARQKVAALIGDRFYCIPSSIHEFICIPESLGTDCGTNSIVTIIKQVNEVEVDPEEQLSDKLYFFNGKEIVYA